MSRPRVLMAMSGGIDSSVAAMLLQKQHYEVIGCTFRALDDTTIVGQAQELALRIGIEHHTLDLRDKFHHEVICPFVEEYRRGRTPNPCVWCNAKIKWQALWTQAEALGCDYIATGHYARIAQHNGHCFLSRAEDIRKDQTYFLWMLTEQDLAHTLFPLGDFTKAQVREMALQQGLVQLSEQKESQDICFIPHNDYRTLLRDVGVETPAGVYINKEGKVLGNHTGYPNYTIGQRKGLGIALGEPAFVTHIDSSTNQVTLGTHDELYTREVVLEQSYFRGDASQKVLAQIRYRSFPTPAIYQEGKLYFDEPVWAVTPGQSAVLYQGNLLVGGGIIT